MKSGLWPQFPQIISKNSTLTKNNRLLQEFKHNILQSTEGCNDEGVSDYRQLLMEAIIYSKDIQEKKKLAHIYRLTKEIIKENMLPFTGKDANKEFTQLGRNALSWLKDGSETKSEIKKIDKEEEINEEEEEN